MHPIPQPSNTSTRRQWLTTVARTAALGGLTAVSGWLILRPAGNSCPPPADCRRCGRLAECVDPRAIHIKQTIQR